jgi:hypothetical protein
MSNPLIMFLLTFLLSALAVAPLVALILYLSERAERREKEKRATWTCPHCRCPLGPDAARASWTHWMMSYPGGSEVRVVLSCARCGEMAFTDDGEFICDGL